jgi:hypothetical protein
MHIHSNTTQASQLALHLPAGNQKALRSHPDTQAFLAALLALGDAPADEAAAAGELPEVRAARSLFR